MIESITTFFSTKGQIDFGNFTVGIATLILVLISLSIAGRNNKSANISKISEFRKEWIENLRLQIAEFTALASRKAFLIIAIRVAEENGKFIEKDHIDKYDVEHNLLKCYSYIFMMLNEKEEAAKLLISEMKTIVDASSEDEFHWEEVVRRGRIIMEAEWKKLKSEILAT